MPASFGSPRPRAALAAVAASLGALVAGVACGRGAPAGPPAAAFPPGTVLALDYAPIRAEDVDAVAGIYARLEPGFVEAHCRRLALTNAVLPLVAARGIDPERRARAKAEAESLKRALDAGLTFEGPVVGPAPVERRGNWKRVGLEAWAAAVDRQDSGWSDVMETPGAFQIVRLLEREKQPVAQELVLDLSVIEFPYLDAENVRDRIDRALDRARLVFVDPAWRDYVPTAWQHRLHADAP